MESKKEYKKFTDYYSDPEFRKRHLAYVNTEVLCECGTNTKRSNLSRHRKTTIHKKRLDIVQNDHTKKVLTIEGMSNLDTEKLQKIYDLYDEIKTHMEGELKQLGPKIELEFIPVYGSDEDKEEPRKTYYFEAELRPTQKN